MDMLSDYDNLDVMLGNENNNPIERELAEAIDQSSAHGDDDTNVYHENEFRDYLHENEPLRQNEVRQSFEAFSSEFNLRLSQEMESMVSIMHSQINRAITTAIAEKVVTTRSRSGLFLLWRNPKIRKGERSRKSHAMLSIVQ